MAYQGLLSLLNSRVAPSYTKPYTLTFPIFSNLVLPVDSSTPAKNETHATSTTRKNVKAKHRTGFDPKWKESRPWLYREDVKDEEGNVKEVMFCSLCQKHNVKARNGSETWLREGCRTVRLDKVTAHESSDIHQQALSLETREQLGIQACVNGQTTISGKEQKAIESAMKCLLFLIRHNIPHTTVFKDFIKFATDELECPSLQHLQQGANATYTSHRTVEEFTDAMVDDIQETLHNKINQSPAYTIMTDETTDIANRKHLAFVVKYVEKDSGEVCMDYLRDVEIEDGKAETIFKETMSIVTKDLDIDTFAAFGSDGCSVMIGNKTGVTTRLKEVKPSLITIHCQNHRLALAAKDSFESIASFKCADETLTTLFKYYKSSAIRTKSLAKIQALLEDGKVVKIKKAAHTRWLSHIEAVSSLRDSYSAVITDLENSVESGQDKVRMNSGPSASGILRKLKNFKMIHIVHFLCDALKPVSTLALTLEKRDIDLTMVQPRLEATLQQLRQLKKVPGLSLSKVPKILQEHGISSSDSETASLKREEDQFIDNLVDNINRRVECSELINSFGALKVTEDSHAFSGNDEVELLAEHFSMDTDTVLAEWDNVKTIMKDQTEMSGPTQLLKVLTKLRTTAGEISPNIAKLCSVAAVLPISTAEVERVFSGVTRTVTELRNRLGVSSMDKLLHLNRNEHHLNLQRAVELWAAKKNRRIQK